MARIVLAVIAAVALGGCANSEAAKRAAAQAAFQAEIKVNDAECQSYGAEPDSDAYVQMSAGHRCAQSQFGGGCRSHTAAGAYSTMMPAVD